MFLRKPKAIPDASDALPGRDQPIELHRAAHGARHAAPAAVPRGDRAHRRRNGLLLGRRADLLADARRVHDRRGLRRRVDAEPDLPRGVLGHDRPHRGGAGRIRPEARSRPRRSCALFWEGHDPTQGMRQGNDSGTQYRSAIYWHTQQQHDLAIATRDAYAEALRAAGRGPITTEIAEAGPFYAAEDYHQQYLAEEPGRLLRHRRNRRLLPDRGRRHAAGA